jgi:hypothetical protein
MAVEKMLNTRIQLRYDTLTNWNNSTLELKAGEVAIATTGETVSESLKGTNKPVLMKVGPGVFKDLPWVSALAADVYDWAKKSETDFTAWVKTLIEVKDIDAYSKGEVDAKLSANSTADQKYAKEYADSLAVNYDPAGKAQELINALDLTDTAVTGKYVSAVSQENGQISVTRADLPTYTLDTGSANGTVAFNGADVAVKGLGSAAYEAKTAFDAAGSAATAKSEAILDAEGKINALKNGDVKANADAISAMKDHASVDSFGDVMTEMAKYQLAGDYATKAQAKEYADALIDDIADAKKAGTDANTALEAYITSNNAAVGLKADKTALEAEVSRATKAEADNLQAAKDYADAVKKSILTGDSETELKEAYDTLVEIQEWMEGDGVNATELTEAIAAETKRAQTEEARIVGLVEAEADRAAKAEKVNADAITALGIVDGKVANAAMADKANSLTDAAKEEVKAVKVDNAAAADDAAKLGGVAAADYATKAYADQAESDAVATAKSYADGLAKNYATAAQGAKADTAVQPAALNDYYTKTQADAAFMDSAETDNAINAKITALNLGTTYEPIGAEDRAKAYADGLAGNYATAAQGAKADSALQEIKTTANGGLKVTNKNQIDIDTDVIFVFNCGTSADVE